MDMQFESVCDFCSMQGVNLNVCSADEHVPEIERFMSTLKECVWALHASLPFKTVLKQVVMALVRHASEWLNVFCLKNSASKVVSPRALMAGRKLTARSIVTLRLVLVFRHKK